MSEKNWKPLPREEVIKCVERKTPLRPPLVMAKWWGEGLHDQYGDRLKEFDRFPQDSAVVTIPMLNPKEMNLSWEVDLTAAYDARVILDDWAKLDEFIEKMPKPENDRWMNEAEKYTKEAYETGIYVHFGWWNFFFEKGWSIRGMENLMMDYMVEPEKVHKMNQALADHYCAYLRHGHERFPYDGFWTSDDLGQQSGLMISDQIYREFMKPYYKQVADTLHELGKHFWLHTCGDIAIILDDLKEVGVDMLHPLQKGTLDQDKIAREYGDKMNFLVGMDVQHTLQEGSLEEVRQEVRRIIDTFDRPEGGMAIASGNGIVSGTPFENIEAYLEEALAYGTAHHAKICG